MNLPHNQDKYLKKMNRIKLFVCCIILVAGLWVLLKVENMMISCLLAFTIHYLFSPWVNYFEHLKLNRLWATTLTLTICIVGLTLFILTMAPLISQQVITFQEELPKYMTGISDRIGQIEDKISETLGDSFDLNLSSKVEELLTHWSSSLFEDLASFLSHSLTTLMLTPFFAFFLLKDGRRLFKSMFYFVPNHYFELVLSLHHQIHEQIGLFIRARLLEAAIVGLVVWCGLIAIQFPFPTILALFAMLTNLIPYVGPFIGVVPAVIIAFINGQGYFDSVLMLSVYGLAQLIDVLFIIPLVVAKIVNLHPVTVVVSIIIGAQLMGIVGMIISIPMANAIKVTTTSIYHHLIHFRS